MHALTLGPAIFIVTTALTKFVAEDINVLLQGEFKFSQRFVRKRLRDDFSFDSMISLINGS